MATSYDDIYVKFLSICKTEDINLPNTDEKIYQFIKSAVDYYNNRMRTMLICNDEDECVTEDLDNDGMIILANFLRLIFLENELTYFTTIWQPFSKDLGLKNYQSQVKAHEFLIQSQEKKIDELIKNAATDYL
jgi:hypothetical protein